MLATLQLSVALQKSSYPLEHNSVENKRLLSKQLHRLPVWSQPQFKQLLWNHRLEWKYQGQKSPTVSIYSCPLIKILVKLTLPQFLSISEARQTATRRKAFSVLAPPHSSYFFVLILLLFQVSIKPFPPFTLAGWLYSFIYSFFFYLSVGVFVCYGLISGLFLLLLGCSDVLSLAALLLYSLYDTGVILWNSFQEFNCFLVCIKICCVLVFILLKDAQTTFGLRNRRYVLK